MPTREQKSLAEVAPINDKGGFLWSCNFAIHAELFKGIDGFDERYPFPCMEDVDLRQRLEGCRKAFLFVPDALVLHPWRCRHPRTEIERYRESLGIFLSLHPARRSDFTARSQLYGVARNILREFVPGLLRYRGRGAANRVLYYWWCIIMIVRGLPDWRSRERSGTLGAAAHQKSDSGSV